MVNGRYTFEEFEKIVQEHKEKVKKQSTYPTFKEEITLKPEEWGELGLLALSYKLQEKLKDYILDSMNNNDGFNIVIKVEKGEETMTKETIMYKIAKMLEDYGIKRDYFIGIKNEYGFTDESIDICEELDSYIYIQYFEKNNIINIMTKNKSYGFNEDIIEIKNEEDLGNAVKMIVEYYNTRYCNLDSFCRLPF